MSLDDLHRHPLFKEVARDSFGVQDAIGLKLTGDFDETSTVDELQFYITRVGFSLSHALGWLNLRLEYSLD